MSDMSDTPGEVYVREANLDDVDAVEQLLKPFVKARLLLRRTREELDRLALSGFVAVAGPPGLTRVACDGGPTGHEIVGFAAVEMYSRKLAEVQCLAVDVRFQRRGLGRELVERCVNWARHKQVLELMAITSSESFLRDCGFDYSLPDQKRAMFVRTHEDHEEDES
ncbi:MAG: GNAT family N-acetyltransferase [Planctomycetales bacterium]|nr:GNAT family N-acetyltransferase [Planctomycetales bacterium]